MLTSVGGFVTGVKRSCGGSFGHVPWYSFLATFLDELVFQVVHDLFDVVWTFCGRDPFVMVSILMRMRYATISVIGHECLPPSIAVFMQLR